MGTSRRKEQAGWLSFLKETGAQRSWDCKKMNKQLQKKIDMEQTGDEKGDKPHLRGPGCRVHGVNTPRGLCLPLAYDDWGMMVLPTRSPSDGISRPQRTRPKTLNIFSPNNLPKTSSVSATPQGGGQGIGRDRPLLTRTNSCSIHPVITMNPAQRLLISLSYFAFCMSFHRI